MQKQIRSIYYAVLLLLIGCSSPEKPVTKQEAIDFAKEVEASLAGKNPNLFNNIFDEVALSKKIKQVGNGSISDDMIKEVPAALKKKRLGEVVIESVANGGMYRMVKNYEKDGTQHVIFRLFGDDGLNYHDMELTHAGKDVKVADMYIYVTGENLSKSFADLFKQIDNYGGSRSSEKAIMDSAAQMRKYIADKEFERALETFRELPKSFREQKLFQLLYLQITSNLSDSLYESSLNDFQRLFPSEASMYIFLIDIHYVRGEFEKALDDVNKMDSFINKDPFLDYYRGLLHKEMKNNEKAKLYYEKLYKNFPDFDSGIIELINIYAITNDMDKAKKLIAVYRKNKYFKGETLEMLYLLHPGLK